MNKDYSANTQNSDYDGPCKIDPEMDVLNWDNLIPVPPARPTRKIRVRLRNIGRDKPIPHSVDEFPLTSLDD